MSATAVCEPRLTTGLSLDYLLARAHEDAQAHGKADCPVCAGTLLSNGLDAQCTICGSRLS